MTTYFRQLARSAWRIFARAWRRPDPCRRVEVTFHNDHYLRLTARSLEHLASLGLPLRGRTVLEVGAGAGDYSSFFVDRGCRMTITDVRPELLAYLRRRYPEQDVQSLDLEAPARLTAAPFEVVLCYGVLYHLQHPAQAIAYLSECCGDLLLVSSQVLQGDSDSLEQVPEPQQALAQSYHGLGSRFTRRWLYNQLQLHFPFVYTPLAQPAHPQFPCNWSMPIKEPLIRTVFVAARQPLKNPLLTSDWLDVQGLQS